MTCAEARDLILEADPSELEGSGESLLADHIRECGRCRAVAGTILGAERSLAAGLADAVEPPDLDELLKKASRPESPKGSILPLRKRRVGLAVLPVVAAAAMVALLFLGEQPRLPGDPYTPPERSSGLGLEIPEGRNAAVLTTNNPNITVLWFFNGGLSDEIS
jgi:hypothetical protein